MTDRVASRLGREGVVGVLVPCTARWKMGCRQDCCRRRDHRVPNRGTLRGVRWCCCSSGSTLLFNIVCGSTSTTTVGSGWSSSAVHSSSPPVHDSASDRELSGVKGEKHETSSARLSSFPIRSISVGITMVSEGRFAMYRGSRRCGPARDLRGNETACSGKDLNGSCMVLQCFRPSIMVDPSGNQ